MADERKNDEVRYIVWGCVALRRIWRRNNCRIDYKIKILY